MIPPAGPDRVRVFAPAKINLCLHVGAKRSDGFHDLASLVVFATVGDELSFERAGSLSLSASGPFASGLPTGEDNLVMRAARLLAATGGTDFGARILLEKNLPSASGIGGGSADAAATLRGLAQLWAVSLDNVGLLETAARIGSDVPMCLFSRAALARGRGELLSFPEELPEIALLMVNPRVAISTAAVFARLQSRSGSQLELPSRFHAVRDLVEYLGQASNDLQAPAIELAPAIRTVLDTLDACPDVLLARLSGSGATCFGIVRDRNTAEGVARDIRQSHPDWWVAAAGLANANAAAVRAA